MDKRKNIVLTGFMGTGKTTAGKIAAYKLHVRFVDTDSEIERKTEKKISEIFELYGEEYFRKLERGAIAEFSRKKGIIIATGGGAVLDKRNVEKMRENGIIVLLKASAEVILRNTSCKAGTRPLLVQQNPLQRIYELLVQRDEYYMDHDYEIVVSDLSIEEVVGRIIAIYKTVNRK